jgi:hypothetical protein
MTENKTHHYAAINERRADSELCVEADASLPRHMTPARTSSRWRRAWQWIVATRARRSALTLAVLAAMATPFATKSYKAQFNSLRYVPLTEEDRTRIINRWGDDKDCEQPYQDAMKTWGDG